MKKFYVGIKGVIKDPQQGILILKDDNFWDIPGGRIDDNEEFEKTLRRELDEELPGITNVKISELLGAHRVQKDFGNDTSLVLLYFRVVATLPDPINLSDEHDGYIWVKSREDIPESMNPQIKKILEGLLTTA